MSFVMFTHLERDVNHSQFKESHYIALRKVTIFYCFSKLLSSFKIFKQNFVRISHSLRTCHTPIQLLCFFILTIPDETQIATEKHGTRRKITLIKRKAIYYTSYFYVLRTYTFAATRQSVKGITFIFVLNSNCTIRK